MVLFSAFYFSWKRKVETDDFRASTYSSKRSGYMMFRDFAKVIGTDIKTLERPMSDSMSNLGNASQIWLIAPEYTYSETGFQRGDATIEQEDEDALVDWVLSGGTLIIAPNYLHPEAVEDLIIGIDYEIFSMNPDSDYDSGEKLTLEPAGRDRLLNDVYYVESFLNESRDTKSILRFSEPVSGGEVLLEDDYGPAVILQEMGKGEVILVADQYIFSNFLLDVKARSNDDYDNAQFAANILAEAKGGLVLFDEHYHARPSRLTFTDVLKTKSGHGLAFLLLVAGIALYSAGRRFGAALPPPPPGRRSPVEYVVSMGLLFRRAAATGLALDVMERDFAHFASQRYRLRTLDIDEVDNQLKLAGNTDREEIVSVLLEFEMLKKRSKPSAKGLVKLSRRIDNLKGA